MATYLGTATATRILRRQEAVRVVFKPGASNLFVAQFVGGMGDVWAWILEGNHSLGVVPISPNPATSGDQRATIDFLVPGDEGKTIASVVAALNGADWRVTVDTVSVISPKAATNSQSPTERQAASDAAAQSSSGSLGDRIGATVEQIGSTALIVLLIVGGFVAWRLTKELRA